MMQLEYPGALYVYLLCSADFARHLYAINPAIQIFSNKRPAQRILTPCVVDKGVALGVCRGKLAGCSNKQCVIRECPKWSSPKSNLQDASLSIFMAQNLKRPCH